MSARDPGTDNLIGCDLDDRYRIEARIGGGGMGAVYRARHLMMDHEVAVKILRPDLASDPNAVRRFAREAKGSFRFDHANCVRVFDFGFAAAAGVVYLVMEHLDGRTIGAELEVDGPMAPRRVAHIARQVAAALAHAHAIGLVHRDLKPDNIMLLHKGGDADFAKVLDFGLAKLFEPDSSGTSIFSVSPLTQDGIVFGTPEYMSPEQATGQTLHPASDLYSLGVVVYQMLTGLLPLEGPTFMATLTKQVREVPVSPATRRPELAIPSDLDELVMRCLAKPISARPASAGELGDQLAAIANRLAAAPSRVSPTLAACDTMELSAVTHPAITTSTTAGVVSAGYRSSRRGLIIGGGLAIGFLLGLFALIATYWQRPQARPSLTSVPSSAQADGGRGGADAGSSVDGPATPGVRRPDPGIAHPPGHPQPRPRDLRIDRHLAAAEKARTSGNILKQIAEADSALRLDRNNREALYLLGDGLVASGDKSRGCGYLSQARQLAKARQRHQSAGCK